MRNGFMVLPYYFNNISKVLKLFWLNSFLKAVKDWHAAFALGQCGSFLRSDPILTDKIGPILSDKIGTTFPILYDKIGNSAPKVFLRWRS